MLEIPYKQEFPEGRNRSSGFYLLQQQPKPFYAWQAMLQLQLAQHLPDRLLPVLLRLHPHPQPVQAQLVLVNGMLRKPASSEVVRTFALHTGGSQMVVVLFHCRAFSLLVCEVVSAADWPIIRHVTFNVLVITSSHQH